MNPPTKAIANPAQFQAKTESESCAAVCRSLPIPSKRKSTARIVPIHNDSPEKCMSCTKGYAQSEPVMDSAQVVFCSHLPKFRSKSIRLLVLVDRCPLSQPRQGRNFKAR